MIHPTLRQEPVEYVCGEALKYSHYRCDNGVGIHYHSHDDTYEVFFFLDGRCNYSIEGKLYTLSPGDILLISNQLVHTSMPNGSEPYERIILSIGPQFLQQHFYEGERVCRCFATAAQRNYHAIKLNAGEQSLNIYQCLAKIESEIAQAGTLSEALLDAYLLQLMVLLNRAYESGTHETDGISVNSNATTDAIIKYINENLAENLSLETLSETFYLSKYHLSREFKRYTGCTVHNFILKKRLLMAKVLLREQKSVLDVSLQCGFGDYSNFVRTFKKEYGITPYQFMNPFKTIK